MPIRRRSAASSSATSTRAAASAGAAWKPISGVASTRLQRQLERERGALAERADDTVTSPPIARARRRAIERPRPVPAQARPWLRVHGSNRRGRSSSAMPRPVSETVIWNLSPETVGVDQRDAALGVLDRVGGEVEDDLAHAGGVAAQRVRHGGVDGHAQLQRAAAQRRAQHAGDGGQQAARVVVGGLGLVAPGLGAGDVEHVAQQRGERVRGVGDDLRQLALARRRAWRRAAARRRRRCPTAAS